MQLSENEAKTVVQLIIVCIKNGFVRDEAAFLELVNLKARIIQETEKKA